MSRRLKLSQMEIKVSKEALSLRAQYFKDVNEQGVKDVGKM